MERNPVTWASIAGVDSIMEYLDRGMRIPGTDQRHWGTDTDIAFANLFDCMVYIYNDHDDVLYQKHYEGYGPRPTVDRPCRDIGDLTTILLYHAQYHFEVVMDP
ncbi:hypothetical protein Aduo_006259 [Ancylostoma duodenale]